MESLFFSLSLYPRIHCNLLVIVTIALHTGHSSALPTATIRTHRTPRSFVPCLFFIVFLCNIHIVTRHSASIHGIFFLKLPLRVSLIGEWVVGQVIVTITISACGRSLGWFNMYYLNF